MSLTPPSDPKCVQQIIQRDGMRKDSELLKHNINREKNINDSALQPADLMIFTWVMDE